MRLLSVSVTAAIMTFGLVGTAVAQEQPARQTFETQEIKDHEAAPENTTGTPEQADDQAVAACPGAKLIGTVGPTERDLVTRPFSITGESFRLTYETSDADQSGLPFFDITVLDAAGKEVGGQVIFEEGVVTEIVNAIPGSFTIEARSEDLKYKITVEDCTGEPSPPPNGNGGNNGQPNPTNPPDDQYDNGTDNPDDNGTDNPDDVVDNTTSDKPLPNTGGVPLLGLGVLGSICVFAAFALLRPVIRRNS